MLIYADNAYYQVITKENHLHKERRDLSARFMCARKAKQRKVQ